MILKSLKISLSAFLSLPFEKDGTQLTERKKELERVHGTCKVSPVKHSSSLAIKSTESPGNWFVIVFSIASGHPRHFESPFVPSVSRYMDSLPWGMRILIFLEYFSSAGRLLHGKSPANDGGLEALIKQCPEMTGSIMIEGTWTAFLTHSVFWSQVAFRNFQKQVELVTLVATWCSVFKPPPAVHPMKLRLTPAKTPVLIHNLLPTLGMNLRLIPTNLLIQVVEKTSPRAVVRLHHPKINPLPRPTPADGVKNLLAPPKMLLPPAVANLRIPNNSLPTLGSPGHLREEVLVSVTCIDSRSFWSWNFWLWIWNAKQVHPTRPTPLALTVPTPRAPGLLQEACLVCVGLNYSSALSRVERAFFSSRTGKKVHPTRPMPLALTVPTPRAPLTLTSPPDTPTLPPILMILTRDPPTPTDPPATLPTPPTAILTRAVRQVTQIRPVPILGDPTGTPTQPALLLPLMPNVAKVPSWR